MYASLILRGNEEEVYRWSFANGERIRQDKFTLGHGRLTVVFLKILTVLDAGPLCCYTISQLTRNEALLGLHSIYC